MIVLYVSFLFRVDLLQQQPQWTEISIVSLIVHHLFLVTKQSDVINRVYHTVLGMKIFIFMNYEYRID
jgi:hypothetical protein